MLQPATIKFLQQIAKNNNKPWFDKHKDEYLAAKEDYEVLVTEVLEGLAAKDPMFKEIQAKDCIMRIFRDVRFSKDKTPYKVNLGAGFSKGGRKFMGAGYYLHIEPGKSFAGGGMWQPEAPMLKALRQEIDYNFKEFSAIINDKSFKKMFKQIDSEDKLKKAPQGYTDDNPALEYLKLKSFTVSAPIADADLTKKGLSKKIVEIYSTMRPFINFLNRSVS